MLVSIVKLLAERICGSCCHQSVSAVRIMIVVPAIARCGHWWIVDSTALTAEPTFTRTSVEICTINSMSITDYLIHSIRLFRTSFVLFFDSEMYENDGRSNDSSRSMISQLVVKFLVLYRYCCRGVEKQPLARPAAHSFKKLFDSLVSAIQPSREVRQHREVVALTPIIIHMRHTAPYCTVCKA